MSSTDVPEPSAASCAELLRALAEDTRLAVMRSLLDGPRRVSELNDTLCLEPSLLSHHLRVLRERGLVEAEREGKAVLYRLAPHVASRRRGSVLDLGCCQLSFEP